MRNLGVETDIRRRLLLPALFVVAFFGLVAATRVLLVGQSVAQPVERIADSFGSDTYLTHVSTDKPIYRGGDTLFVRGIRLSSRGHFPLQGQEPAGHAAFEIKGPKGDTVFSGSTAIADSILGFSWPIPADQPGGEYRVRILHPAGDPPTERKFDIRAYRAPRLKTQIVFVRDGYGPGDTVSANLHVERAEGGAPAGAKVLVTARVDGREVWSGETAIDELGNAGTNFRLPLEIARGEGVIAMVIEDGGVVETATKTIPILLQTLDLALYPEGGDLVAGLSNRVYIEGKTPTGKPADIAGIVTSSAGVEVGRFRTEHEGRGRFSFVPARGETYTLRITEPAGIQTTFALPPAKSSGVVLSSASDVIAKGEDAAVRLQASDDSVYEVTLSQKNLEISSRLVMLRGGRPFDITLPVPAEIDGVVVATVYDDRKTPVAERLLFRQPARILRIDIVPDRTDYVPGDKVTLRVTTSDASGKPVAAMVGLTVTDSSVLEMIDKREQAPRLPVMVLLENDVRDLSEAHVYLDESHPKSRLATDLLLGTQGWRRFAAADAPNFVTRYEDAARRALGIRMMPGEVARIFPAVEPMPGMMFFNRPMAALAAVGQVVQEKIFPAAPFVELDAVALLDAPPRAAEVVAGLPEAERDERFDLQKLVRDNREFGGRPQEEFARRVAQVRTIREYAHTLRAGWTPGSRSDFSETVYWNAGVKTDATTGRATVSFNLSDSVTSFSVLADGFNEAGALGSQTRDIQSVTPFSIEPKVPLQVTAGDVIHLPIGVINGTSGDIREVSVAATTESGIRIDALAAGSSSLSAKERARRLLRIDVGQFSGAANIAFAGRAGNYRDTVVRTLDVQPLGFPNEKSRSGILQNNGTQVFEFTLPETVVPGSLDARVVVYPTPLASMTDALESLLGQPYGCFEQTSSTSYPMVMAQQYFMTHSGVDPAVVQKAKDLLEVSYKRLTGFESRSNGYEWFGADPAHEALTAYGLMQFTDMAQVRNVDKAMVDRTRAWLLERRDGKGGFSLNSRALDSFGRAPADTTNAYIVWALAESGSKNLEREVAAVKASANSTSDSYIVALAANILHIAGDRAGARQLMDKLVKNQNTAGDVRGASTSITQSGGQALAIETTALSVLAWLREPEYVEPVQKGLRWITESNKSGRFGSTQSTVLALRAIVAFDAANARPKAPGKISLLVDGKPFGAPVSFSPNTQGAIVLPDFARELGAGKHTLALRMEGGSPMPFSSSVKYHNLLPEDSELAPIGIQVALKDARIQEGNVTEATVAIANRSGKVIPTPVAIIGVPGGLEVRHDQLKELVKAGRIDAYEVIGREVILYWRALKAHDRFDLPLSLVAAIPGSYTGPASRAYAYYTDEHKEWAPGVKVTIVPR
jgi:hypothetical protein